MIKHSITANAIISILNNINDLIVVANDRKNAAEEMRALKMYSKNNKFPLPEEKIQNFFDILIDSKPYTLSFLIKDIAVSVIKNDLTREMHK